MRDERATGNSGVHPDDAAGRMTALGLHVVDRMARSLAMPGVRLAFQPVPGGRRPGGQASTHRRALPVLLAGSLVGIPVDARRTSAWSHEPAAMSGGKAATHVETHALPVAGALTERARSMQQVWNGVVVAPDGRLFVAFPRLANPSGVSLAQVAADGTLIPYPDAAWNGADSPTGHKAPKPADIQPDAKPPDTHVGPGPVFIGLNAIHLSPDGALWAVDTGSPGFGRPGVAGGARLIRIDLASNQVTRILTLPAEVLHPRSMIDDIRFNGDHAYITDAGSPGLIVLDLKAGSFRRVLDHDPSMTAQRPIIVEGETLKGPDGKPVMINADQLEVTPDGRYLYVQPLPGPMVRIETALLDDPQVAPRTLSAAVRFWYDTPALGGTAIASDGTLYLNDLETDSILGLSPKRVMTLLVHDVRLHWADAPFLSPDGTLTVPVPQLDRAAPFHHGHSQIQFPVMLYTLQPAALAAIATPTASGPSVAPPAATDRR